MRTFERAAPFGEFSMGTLFLVVNDIPEVCHCTYYKTNLKIAREAKDEDPFAIVFLLTEQGTWFKGDYCYTDGRHKFTPVGKSAVPQLILMMNVVKP
jgi:hypothetical protein